MGIKKNVLKVLKDLDVVIQDCKAQANSLKQNQDVDWDCYDIQNWHNLQEIVEDVKKQIKEEIKKL